MAFKVSAFLAVVAVAAAVAATPAGARADEYTVTMKGRTFSPQTLRIRPGDTIRFVNDDSVTHSVFSLTRGHYFASGPRAPGRHAVFLFNRPGAFDVLEAADYDTVRLHVEVAAR